MTVIAIKEKVDRFAELSKQLDQCKKELDTLKGEFQQLGIEELNDKKLKQVEFWGGSNAKVVVTCSESVKVVSHTFLQQTLGDILKDFTKEETTYKYTDPFKRILTSIFQGAYVEQSLDRVIEQITEDETARKALKKKLKGNWEKDVGCIKDHSGLGQEEAENFAYFVQEAINYGKIVQLLEAAGHPTGTNQFEAALRAIKNAIVVDEGIKVGLEADEVA